MRAVRLVADRELRVVDVPVPEIDPDEVLVRVAGAGVCHTDLTLFRSDGWPAKPMTLGHETAGHIAQVGADVVGHREGDAVLVSLVWACGTCRACVDGRDNVCITTGRRKGPPPGPGLGPDGGMADYIKVGHRFIEPLGSLDPTFAGPLADAGLTPYHAIDGVRERLKPGATAVVIGVGGLGHIGLQILKATTGVRVIALDTSEEKLAIARAHGADEAILSDDAAAGTILEMTGRYGADAVFDFAGVQRTVDLATRTVAPDGALRFVGLGGGSFRFTASAPNTVPWGVDVRQTYTGTRRDLREVIELARAGKISIETQQYALEDGVKAFADLENGKVRGRAILVPGD